MGKKKRKVKGGSKKGNPFERWFCKELSLWWSNGKRDDIFSRVGGSGGRARIRARKGKATAGGHGDVFALDHIGNPLIDLITWECKIGYPKADLQDLLDKPKNQKYAEWVNKTKEACEQSGSFAWAIAVRRNCKKTIVIAPKYLYDAIMECNHRLAKREKEMWIRFQGNILVVMPLEDFFQCFTPEMITITSKAC